MTKSISVLTAIALGIFLATVQSARAQATADQHLNQAKTLLDTVTGDKGFVSQDKGKDKDAAEEIGRLRRDFAALMSAYESSRGATGVDLDWKLKFSEVERTLSRIIGGGSVIPSATAGAAVVVSGVNPPPGAAPTPATGADAQPAGTNAPGVAPTAGNVPGVPAPTAGTVPATPPTAGVVPADPAAPAQPPPGTVPTNQAAPDPLGAVAAAKVSTIGIADLNPDVRRQLEKFRTELELVLTSPIGDDPGN